MATESTSFLLYARSSHTVHAFAKAVPHVPGVLSSLRLFRKLIRQTAFTLFHSRIRANRIGSQGHKPYEYKTPNATLGFYPLTGDAQRLRRRSARLPSEFKLPRRLESVNGQWRENQKELGGTNPQRLSWVHCRERGQRGAPNWVKSERRWRHRTRYSQSCG